VTGKLSDEQVAKLADLICLERAAHQESTDAYEELRAVKDKANRIHQVWFERARDLDSFVDSLRQPQEAE
jgi:hypothetical protein